MIGAGAAGLAAASRLADAGLSVRILEARDRVGGRIYSLHEPRLPVAIELGAEFVQGTPAVTLDLAREAGLLLYELNGGAWRMANGRMQRASTARYGHNALFEALATRRLAADCSLAEFAQCVQTPDNDRALYWINAYDAADPSEISARALVRQHRAEAANHEDHIFRLPLGYDGVLSRLHAALANDAVVCHAIVASVAWTPGQVDVTLVDGRTFSAERIVVAIPLPVLQHDIAFDPPLDEKQRAMRLLRMGSVIKVAAVFDEPFWWTRDQASMGWLETGSPAFQVWWTTYPVIAPVLVGWCGGPAAAELARLSDEEIESCAVRNLVSLFGRRAERRLVGVHVHNWQADPFAGGAYSYVGVGGLRAQRALAQPVADTLFFAGEATEFTGHHATVHGAIATGYRAAAEVLAARGTRGAAASVVRHTPSG